VSEGLEFRCHGSRIVRPGSAQARAWNRRIQAVVRHDSPGKLPFFCECGIEYCRYSVWLTLREAREVIESGELIIGAHFFEELEARAALGSGSSGLTYTRPESPHSRVV